MDRYKKGQDAGQFHFDENNASYVKAELIRRDLLSRKDLMQLYRPPPKKSELAQNNPFHSKTIVGASKIDFGPLAVAGSVSPYSSMQVIAKEMALSKS